MSSDAEIAIVIPYYKPDFLAPLLAALQRESRARTNVYLFDDCSPSPAQDHVGDYAAVLHKSLRFDDNLGGIALTEQWDRCLSHIGAEEWVWFLPDDDLLKPGAVAKIRAAADDAPPDVSVLHLATEIIDGSGRDLGFHDTMASEKYEAVDFYHRVLRGETMITLGSQVYRRRALSSGFVAFPKAWGSDHATTLACAGRNSIMHLGEAILQFRMSDLNISSQKDDWRQKADARVQFAEWLAAFVRSADTKTVSSDQIRDAFLLKGESFFVNTCPLHWRTLVYARDVAKALGADVPASYPLKMLLIKLWAAIRRP